MFLSGGGRQPLSASPVLFLAAYGQLGITSPYGTAERRLPSVIVSPALCVSTSRGLSKSRLYSGLDSHVSEFGGTTNMGPKRKNHRESRSRTPAF